MTVDEVAEFLRCSRETLYRLLNKGEIPGAFRVGSDWRVSADQFEEYIRQSQRGHTTPSVSSPGKNLK